MQTIAEDARDRCERSVVLVRDKTDLDGYCTGCVMVRSRAIPGSGDKTLIITSSSFVLGREHNLEVVFQGAGRQLRSSVCSATVERTSGSFAMLSVNFHSDCDAIDLVDNNTVLDNSRCFMYVPADRSETRFVFAYETCSSLESYEAEDPVNAVPTSGDYFTVSCNYFGKTGTGLNRITGAPVFCAVGGLQGRARGIILQEVRHATGCSGREFKVALTATHIRRVWQRLDAPPPPPPRQRGAKRKRGKRGTKRGPKRKKGKKN